MSDARAEPRASRWSRHALSVALLGLCALALRRLDGRGFVDALAHADASAAALAAGLNLLHVVSRAERWRLLMAPIARPPRRSLYYYVVVAWGASMVLPPTLGEVLRVHALRRRHGVSVTTSAAVALAEKLFEALGLAVILLPAPLLLRLPPAAEALVIALSAGGVLTGVTLAAVARNPAWERRAARWSRWSRVSPALDSLRSTRVFAAVLAWSVVGHALECVVVVVMFAAVGIDLPPAASLAVLLGHAFAALAPLTPGRVGSAEAGVVAALGLLGVPMAPSLAFALAWRATQLVPALALIPGHRLLLEERAAQGAGAESGSRRA